MYIKCRGVSMYRYMGMCIQYTLYIYGNNINLEGILRLLYLLP